MPATTDGCEARITILADNHAAGGLASEHGLSMWVEAGGIRILFDTGHGDAMRANAGALGVDVSRADVLVLSHGHYDHTGGVAWVLQRAPKVALYCHPGVIQPRFSVRAGQAKPIGMPRESRDAIEGLPAGQVHWTAGPEMLTDRVGITGQIPRESAFEDTGGPFFLDPEGKCADPLEDDLALWIATETGLVVCVGCSHSGLVNTLHHVRRLAGDARIRVVIGGFHLVSAGQARLDQTVAALRALDPEAVIPCHCTGDGAVAFLARSLGTVVAPGQAGQVFEF